MSPISGDPFVNHPDLVQLGQSTNVPAFMAFAAIGAKIRADEVLAEDCAADPLVRFAAGCRAEGARMVLLAVRAELRADR
ncbi:hypothetical protein [Frankia sp. Cas3]|uniref:hypothetical protein n=1 Tax=Frankia sp. Cas3 TaxID=3073926 RepID=UPI002AD55F0E|nr:hypothetical protein [Frankia sp. Cas3]